VALQQKFIKQMDIKQGLGVLGIYQNPIWNFEIYTDDYRLSM
jgi:hypothetical protein